MPGGLGQLLMGVPLVAMCVFVLVKMRGRQDPWVSMGRAGFMLGVLCFSVVVVWGLTRSLCLMPYLSKTVAAIRRAPVADVKAVELLPTSRAETGFDLVGDKVRLEDKATIQRIVGMLRSAKPWDPNHAETKWVCLVALDFGERRSYCKVSSTTNQGTLITICTEKDQGWHLAQYRHDRLGDLLEQLAGQDKGPSPVSSRPSAD